MSSLKSTVLTIVVALFCTPSVLGAAYPTPTGPGEPLNMWDGQYLYPYSSPFVDHAGRFLDSAFTADLLYPSPRTLRATEGSIVPENDRIYMSVGQHFVGYQLSTFFGTTLGSPLSTELTAEHGSNAELYLPWANHVYPEEDGSGWSTYFLDGQKRLFAFDRDDRGYVYVAYYIWGFGILDDSDFSTIHQVDWNATDTNPQKIASFKTHGRYYVIVGGANTEIWDVTDPATPFRERQLSFKARNAAVAHLGGGDVLGLEVSRYDADLERTVTSLELYTAIDLVAGATPIQSIEAGSEGAIVGVATDQNNFYAIQRSSPAGGFTFHTLILSDSAAPAFIRTAYQIDGLRPTGIRYGSNHLTVWGVDGTLADDVWIYRLESGVPVRQYLGNFIRNYYTSKGPPTGYTNPAVEGGYTRIEDVLYTEYEGKQYLFVSAYGLGDVYELALADLPDPLIHYTGCTEVGEPCELTMSSAVGKDVAAWGISWFLDEAAPVFGETFQPAFSAADTYYVRAVATNEFGSAEYVQPLTIAPECSGGPGYIAISYQGVDSGCGLQGCTDPNETFEFAGLGWQYTIQECDTFSWVFSDGSTSTERNPRRGNPGTRPLTVNLTVSNPEGHSDAALTLKFRTIGDLSGDGRADLLWRRSSDGSNAVWSMKGSNVASISMLDSVKDENWEIVGSADFNRDGFSDIFWRNKISGQNAVWYMNGEDRLGVVYMDDVSDVTWTVAALADFDGDLRVDILWYNTSTGKLVFWYMNGITRQSIAPFDKVKDTNWRPMGAGDFNGDDAPDIVWRHMVNGTNKIWSIVAGVRTGIHTIEKVGDMSYELVAVGDFDGGGNADLVWRHTSGRNYLWIMEGLTRASVEQTMKIGDTSWEIVGPN